MDEIEFGCNGNLDVTIRSGSAAPAFNSSNLPELDTEGNTLYYLGGNANFGFSEEVEGRWTLIDTDCNIADSRLESVWSDWGDDNNNQHNNQQILDYTKKLADDFLTVFERQSIIKKDVAIENWNFASGGEAKDVILWPASREEYRKNNKVAGKIYENSDGYVWSRSFSGRVPGDGDFAHYICDASGMLDDFNDTKNVYGIAPAFNLNLKKVLITRYADSDIKNQEFAPYEVPKNVDLKFLLLGDKVSSFCVKPVCGWKKEKKDFLIFDFCGAAFDADFISAIIYNDSGKILYSGDICRLVSDNGRFAFQIPNALKPGKYILAIFLEKRNPSRMSDYASVPIYFEIIKEERGKENGKI